MGSDLLLPGDKSIAHRALILATLARGETRLTGLPASADVRSTAAAPRSMGAQIDEVGPGALIVHGPAAWSSPGEALDCGNSGTTARLLMGLIAGHGQGADLTGDDSLRRRPMDRVVYPLQAMGARIGYLQEPDRLPIRVESRASGSLRPLRYRPRVASAQVKSSLLLAALTARTDLELVELTGPRDHTERILAQMGAPVRTESADAHTRVRLRARDWNGKLRPLAGTIPGDASSAAFLVIAAILSGRPLRVRGVCLNPTRTGYLDVLRAAGCEIELRPAGVAMGEPVGDIAVVPGELGALRVESDIVPRLIDELPVLAVAAARARGVSELRGASELRHKESDRLMLLARNLVAIGVECEELPDGLRIRGTSAHLAGSVRTDGDHRLAMAFGVLSRLPDCDLEIDDRDCVATSFPGFWIELDRVVGNGLL